MSQIKKGKKPLSSKPTTALFNVDDIFTNHLAIPAEIKKYADSQGWELRWVDADEMIRNGGQHKRGWLPFVKPEELKSKDTLGFKLGNDPDGIVRRTSLLLAYRPKIQGDKHRAFNRQRAELSAAIFNKEQAEKFRQEASENNMNVEVLEGFEENE